MITPTPYKQGMTIKPPMLITGMPNDVYHAWPEGISSSGLKQVERSPAHYRYQPPEKHSPSKHVGSATHVALLEPHLFAREYVQLKETDSRVRSEYKEAKKVHSPDVILIAPEVDRIAAMQESVNACPLMRDTLQLPGWREAALFVRDPETGVLVRVRFDLLTEAGDVVDLKTTQDARADAFSRSIMNYGYDLSAALYVDALHWAGCEVEPDYLWAVVESEMPHACKVYRPDDLLMDEGRRRYREALQTVARCESEQHWPALECDAEELITLPPWRVRQIENETEMDVY